MTTPDPVSLAVDLPVPAERAFDAFAGQFAHWWPAATHSLSRDPASVVRMHVDPGGAIEECDPDGNWHRWGTMEYFEPGRRLRFSWHPGREVDSAQWVDVTFVPTSSGSRATLTHGGWDALGEIAPILRKEYASGWQYVFGEIYPAFVRRLAQ